MNFISNGQFYIFLACISFGAIWGIFYLPIILFKQFKVKWLNILLDLVFFVLLSASYFLYSFTLRFPSVRLYMLAGVLVGLFISAKSFNIILAKFIKKIYNIIDKRIKEKLRKLNGRRKKHLARRKRRANAN